jgi:hypothetical protein
MHRPFRTLAAILLVALAACGTDPVQAEQKSIEEIVADATAGAPGDPVSSDLLTARTTPTGVQLTNKVSSNVFYMVAERGVLALILWAPCTSTTQCTPLGPSASKEVPNSEIIGTAEGTREFVVLHWQVRTVNGRAEPDSIRAVVVTR